MDGEIAYARIHREGSHRVLAACDRGIMGMHIDNDGNPITISREFYGEDLVTIQELKVMAMGVNSINLMGEIVVNLFISEGLMDTESVMEIDSIPHAQIYFM